MKTNVTILALALAIACMQSAQAQSFKKVKVALNAPIVQVASGGASVWALASNGQPYIYNGKSFVQANTIALSQVAVGGGNAAQADAVWGLSSSGNIYRASKSGTSWIFSQVPGSLAVIAVGPGYHGTCQPYEVWGLNTGSQIYRYNFCTNNFDQEPGSLCEIQVGGGDIWGAECGPKSYRFNFGGFFDLIPDPFGAIPVLTAGPGGVVWAIDTSTSDIYRYDDSAGFVNLGCCLAQIQAGGDGVWGIAPNNIVYRWEPSGQYFGQALGASLLSISVGSGGGVWGVNTFNQVVAFTTP